MKQKYIFCLLPHPSSFNSFNIRKKKVVTYSGDSTLIAFFAKCLLKVSKIQTVIFGIVSVPLKFNFKSVKINCFVIHNLSENLVALVCVESRKSLLTLWWLVKSDANHCVGFKKS